MSPVIDNQIPIAFISGASQRIGRDLALHFHAHGYTVGIHYHRSGHAANALAKTLNQTRQNSAFVQSCDLSQPDDVDVMTRMLTTSLPRLDLLINNASIFVPDTSAGWDTTLNTNTRAHYQLSTGFRPLLKKAQGSIINLIDIYAHRPLRHHSIYCASKAASEMLTKSLALEFAPDVRVNGIAPGAILWPEKDLSEQAKQALLDKIPLGCLGSTEAITLTADYLHRCDYISGQVISVDGGRSITL